ncbi:hypothetical protein [Clostridium butyricum]|uniref:Uncharacterized protein n=1 Tax=Clostridium butyricum E4 str. BoNT E BL5262 TaxID=632245 RepID=C4IFP9_CLOBU|nr:hypothetical protein [Clostridium butyricum]EDT74928.1 hypothetical protein CBY_1173 [Clostridium butyricum 5521]EEP54295.1 hypothetical protein CLP_1753 [Clostridium butyricum E4 str. BoNT E BL5262]NFL30357.1 hypothetical protein [Clostridium butyricum]NFS17353.1 hypothetical protein [Clostridium butyricum]
MGQNIIYNDECLSYDEVCERFSYVQDEYSIDEDFAKNKEKATLYVSQYTKEEIEFMLKECICATIKELEKKVNSIVNCAECVYNTEIKSWNELIASIRVDEDIIELKLTNDFVCDSHADINYIYITLYKNGKGVFTECIERISEEYEFTGSSFVPITENEIYFKALDKNEFIDRVLSELR